MERDKDSSLQPRKPREANALVYARFGPRTNGRVVSFVLGDLFHHATGKNPDFSKTSVQRNKTYAPSPTDAQRVAKLRYVWPPLPKQHESEYLMTPTRREQKQKPTTEQRRRRCRRQSGKHTKNVSQHLEHIYRGIPARGDA